jgi:general stress protein 26
VVDISERATMDSINHQQPEDNHEDLAGVPAIRKLKKLAEGAETCFFCTSAAGSARPMSVRYVDDEGNLWFLSAADSHKNQEIEADPRVKLYFQGATHSEFLSIDGLASISRDKGMIRDLWNFVLKTWFTEGENDPRITLIKVVPTNSYYWDTKHGKAVSGAKILVGAVMGVTLDDSIEGQLRI